MVQSLGLRNVHTARADGDDHFNFMVHVLGQGRIREITVVEDQVVGVFVEEKRQLAVRVMAHFAGVLGVVATDAVNPAHRKAFGFTLDADRNRFGRCEQVVGVVGQGQPRQAAHVQVRGEHRDGVSAEGATV